MRFSYASSLRLKKRWEFDMVFRTGRQQRGELVRMYFLHRPGEKTRFGVTAGKKIANAAGRARGRRLLRESVRRIAPWVRDEFWVVFSMRKDGLDRSAVEVYGDIADVAARARLFSNEWSGPDWFALPASRSF